MCSDKSDVRRYWADVGGPLRAEHHWIGYTPAVRMHVDVDGDKPSLYFERLWMDVDDDSVGSQSFSYMNRARVRGRWLVKEIRVGKIETL